LKNIASALAVLLSLATFSARADDNLTWIHPVEYTDSAPLALDAIESTIIRYGVGTSANPPTLLTSHIVLAPATSAVIPRDVAVAGTVCYQAATLLKPVPPSTEKGQSIFAPAAWVCKTQNPLPPKKPRAPRNLSVQ
jgi:hypothetical protein